MNEDKVLETAKQINRVIDESGLDSGEKETAEAIAADLRRGRLAEQNAELDEPKFADFLNTADDLEEAQAAFSKALSAYSAKRVERIQRETRKFASDLQVFMLTLLGGQAS